MAAIVAAFNNSSALSATLAELEHSALGPLLFSPNRKSNRDLLVLSSVRTELEQLKLSCPWLASRRVTRLIDRDEGGVRGALFGLLTGALLVQVIGFGIFFFGKGISLKAIGWGSSDVELSTIGPLISLFLGTIGALIGGIIGWVVGRHFVGLPAATVELFEQHLSQGGIILVYNRRRFFNSAPARVRPGQATHPDPFNRLYFWLGEHAGCEILNRVRGSAIGLNVTPRYTPRSQQHSAYSSSARPDEEE